MLGILKPEYIFRPQQTLARFRQPPTCVSLPWGRSLKINAREIIGRSIWVKGVYDLIVTEALWRLTDKSDVAVDAGANIGYMTSLLSVRAAEVHAFEPHPAIFNLLSENAASWSNVKAYNVALSNVEGTAYLSEPEGYEENGGLARISDEGLKIRTIRLDSLAAPDVLKLDVEGHELQVLEGAGRIRDIIFEEHRSYPTDVTDLLAARGYTLYSLGQTLFGPRLYEPGVKSSRSWEAQSYLATLDRTRAEALFKHRGWESLKKS